MNIKDIENDAFSESGKQFYLDCVVMYEGER